MRKSFAKVAQPMLAGVVKERCPKDAIAQIRNCKAHGATGIDLHISCFDAEYQTVEHIRSVVDSTDLPILALNYNFMYDGSKYECDEDSRVALLMKAVEAGVAAIDIQGYTFDLYSRHNFREEYSSLEYSFIKGNPKEIVLDEKIIEKQMHLIDKVHSLGAEVLLSNHTGIPMSAEQLVDFAKFLEKRGPDIIKIVTPAETDEEMLESFRAMIALKKEIKTPVSYHCNGKKGALTRVINPVLGGFMCFCNDRFQHNSDINQPMLEVARTAIDSIKRII